MDKDTKQAYDWAKGTNYHSVAADYARCLALELDRIAAERDRFKARAEAALTDLSAAKPCGCCEHQYTDECLLEECMDPCSAFIEGGKWEWRGPQEGANP